MREAWARIDERNVERSKNNKPPSDNTLDQLQFEEDLRALAFIPIIGWYARIAAKVESADVTPDEARAKLRRLLSIESVDDLDRMLLKLELDVPPLVRTDSTRMPDFELIKQHELMRYVKGYRQFEAKLDQVYDKWKAKDWDLCKKLLRDLRDVTRSPNKAQASSIVQAGSLFEEDLLGSANPEVNNFLRLMREWMVKTLIPAYRWLDSTRDTFRRGFFLESEYYLGLCPISDFQDGPSLHGNATGRTAPCEDPCGSRTERHRREALFRSPHPGAVS